ncbi:MAG TPA: AI-2E family transporter [Acidobacteriaceae bacterium]|nr:AI-2E family transporter [Acidobacteriaceae bacterium]
MIVGIGLLLVFAKLLLIPLTFALTLSLLLLPAVSWLEKRRLSRNAAVIVASVFTCAILTVGALVLSRQVLNVAQTLPSYSANIQARIRSLHSSAVDSLQTAVDMIEDVSGNLTSNRASPKPNALPVQIVTPKSEQLSATETLIGEVLAPAAEIGVIVIFTIYMLMNWEELRHRLLLLAGMTNLNLMTRALDDATERISRYLVSQFQVNAGYGFLFGMGLFFLHVPDALLWGVIAGAIRIVPFVGTLIAMLFPLALSIAVSPSWVAPICVVVLFLVLETIAVYVVEPRLFSSRTGISSLALLASAIFWAMLWGWPGLVLSTPLTVCVVVLGRHVPQFSFLHSLLGTDAHLSPPAHVYERLLALDQAEVLAIAERYLHGHTLATLYDAVVLPVLSLSEEDRHKGVLDKTQSTFVLLSLGELVARLEGYAEGTAEDEGSARSITMDALRMPLQKEFAVVCLTAGDRAAELATMMLTQLLENGGYQTLMMKADSASDEILKVLADEKDTVIFISALPPFAFAQTRAVYQRVRTYLPENRIAVALWNAKEDGDDLLEHFRAKRPDVVLSTLAQAVKQVTAWQQATRK